MQNVARPKLEDLVQRSLSADGKCLDLDEKHKAEEVFKKISVHLAKKLGI